MAATLATLNLGFLTILHEASGYLGGYLVTNAWGRPLEFRLSSAVQPNRVQQILYAGTLQGYVCADLIGRTLVEKTATAAQLVLTDTEAALDLRLSLEVPVGWLVPTADIPGQARPKHPQVRTHPRYPEDTARVQDLLTCASGLIDLSEPFARIREAIAEARKLGVTNRA